MSKMFRFGSKKDLAAQEFKCTICLLEENELLECVFTKENNGQFLMNYCYAKLGVHERDYFGLRYVDTHSQRTWLDPNRPIYKQVKGLNPLIFCFRVKFYPSDIKNVNVEMTRYLLFLQLRRDLQHGRLQSEPSDLAFLSACIVQSELGDYDRSEHTGSYVKDMKLIPKQECFEAVMREAKHLHINEMKGKTPAEVELLFLKKAFTLDTYGIDPYPVKDQKGVPLFLGINHLGILAFQGYKRVHFNKWSDICKVNYEGRMLIIHLMHSNKKSYIGYKCSTPAACHFLWRSSIENKYFFTMDSSKEVPHAISNGWLFFKQSKFQYSGRVQREMLQGQDKSSDKSVQRSQSMMVGSSKTLPRGSTLTSTPQAQVNAGSLDDSAIHRYMNTSTRSEPVDHNLDGDNSRFNHVGPSNRPFQPEIDLHVDLTPSDAMFQSERPERRIAGRDERSKHSFEPSTSKFRLHPPAAAARGPANDLDKVSEHADDEQLEHENLAHSAQAPNSELWNQRTDSATRRKLTRQQATTGENQNVGIRSTTPELLDLPITPPPWTDYICPVACSIILGTMLFILLASFATFLFYEIDSEYLDSIREWNDFQLFHELYYLPGKTFVQKTFAYYLNSILQYFK